MAWIANVLPHTTITSVWGNLIRSQVVQRFASPTERDTQTAGVRQSGMLAWTDSDHRLQFVDSDNNTWHDLRDCLPAIPEWRAGYSGLTGVSATITFSSPMTVAPIVTVALNTVYGTGQDQIWVTGTTLNGFSISRLSTGAVNFYWTAVPPR